jgi:hypothetical protein
MNKIIKEVDYNTNTFKLVDGTVYQIPKDHTKLNLIMVEQIKLYPNNNLDQLKKVDTMIEDLLNNL